MEQSIEVKSPISISDIFADWTLVIIDANDTAHVFKDDANGELAYDGYRKEFSKIDEASEDVAKAAFKQADAMLGRVEK
ncbi:hypothetical protein LCGC14_2843110 [marine sediment metagenome]|uniref:Uncharacterized protein n=1 Tax=marine sediment metagenome TaxID=412755 RepID=A0A0F9B1R1_9ZZZZ